MDREDAIAYLERKGELTDPLEERKFTKEEEKKIKEVMKEGKIYGDPVVELS